MKIHAIIQARTGSSRLPEKVMKKLHDKTVLSHVIERVKQSNLIDNIIIATTIHERDDIIEEEAVINDVLLFRGSEDDVLARYYLAAKKNKSDVIIRITSDCPLIDPNVIDEIVDFYLKNDYEIVTNASIDISKRTYPRGLDIEVFSFNELEKAYLNAIEKYQREHVTPYIYEHNQNIYYYCNDVDYSNYRWTLDTKEDLELITKIYDSLYKGSHDFYLKDIVKLLEKNPQYVSINSHIEQKKIKDNE